MESPPLCATMTSLRGGDTLPLIFTTLLEEFIMAKSPVIKFPRLSAGFYSVTKDGEFVGYVMKEVEGKETNWYIFDDKEQGKDVAMLHPENAIDAPDALLREAKESAKSYFLNKPEVPEVTQAISLPKDAEWVEEAPEAASDAPEDDDLTDDEDLFLPEDETLELFDDDIFDDEDELEFNEVNEEEMALA